ncbi:hypothetical protein OHT57_19745 [Streptomyces sp. NBC_00285]|uniref:DUF6879 family protein n=1 Tax=Streptomyces sp. NBC_00285 TaxID=2975700 RepID=UPI002E287E7F|nr:DUF6879 family protein [Streptomyces sp. NBC_00285]
MPQNVPSFDELMETAQHSAVHLEMRDQYSVGDEVGDFETWLRTGSRDSDPASEYWAPWVDMISRAVARGVAVRRARIVSEPVTDYIRYEHAGAVVNVAAGEQVRWLPRRRAVDLLLPGADLWIFDGTQVLFNHFSGAGDWADPPMEMRSEPELVKQCSDAFEAIWERGVPHSEYAIH